MRLFLVLIVILTAGLPAVFLGCSSGEQPVLPVQKGKENDPSKDSSSHAIWGYWQFVCDPDAGKVDVIQLRDAQLHLNALRFLEPPANLYLTLESPPHFAGNKLTVDIGLRHPFLGQVIYTGFDACGILVADATHFPYGQPGLLIGGAGDTRLLNADGYTRWWNPTEFPYNPAQPIAGYIDGELGTPDSVADFSGILNGYKYFCDDLDSPDAPMSYVDPQGRGVFSAGQKNVRTYVISIEGGLVFNYAVDANWAWPDGNPPFEVPDDFPAKANRPEAWNISVNVLNNELYYDESTGTGGGSAKLSIDVYDWFNAGLNMVLVHSFNGDVTQDIVSTGTDGGVGYSTYEIDLIGTPTSTDPIPVLIEVASEVSGYGGKLPGESVASYFTYELEVAPQTPEELPDICNNWADESGHYHHWKNGQTIDDIYTQFNLASDSYGNVWMWCQRTSNALSRSETPFNGDWNNMWEEYLTGANNFWIFWGSTIDVSLTNAFDGGLVAGCSPPECTDPNYFNPLSIAWWDGSTWFDKEANQWKVYDVTSPNMIAQRINGYRDSAGFFHAFIQVDGEFIDYYGDTWKGDWEFTTIADAPVGQPDYACQTRTDFVSETSDGYIYLCWVDGGLKVCRSKAGTHSWEIIPITGDQNYDSPTIYVDKKNRIFVAARYYISETEDQIHIFKSTDGTSFGPPLTIFSESGTRVDPCYLTLKGDIKDHLFLTFPYRPSDEGAYAAIMASKSGGDKWTDVCVLSNPIIKHPAMAVRPDGSIEVCYGYNVLPGSPDQGSIDTPGSEGNLVHGRSHPGFID